MSKRIARLKKPLVNRIVGHGEEAVDQLLANPLNYRLHPDNQQHALAGSIDDIGFIRSVTVNRRTGRVVDGHLRVTLAARSGVATLPVEYVDLSEAEEAQALLSLDPIAAMAASDKQKLDELMRAVQSDDERVQTMLAEMAEREGLDYGKAEPAEDPGAQVDKAEELRQKWGVESGQLWQLGEHRLICGDSTDRAVVEQLLRGDKPGMMVTDPPYGVAYDPEWRNEAAEKGLLSLADRREGRVENDDRADWTEAWLLFPGDVVYCWHAGRRASEVQTSLEVAGFEIRNQVIWAKQNFAISRGNYHWKHEPCWYAVRKGKSARWCGGRSQTTLWEIQWDKNAEGGHGTQKPIECMERPIRNHEWEMVYDPFLGSGTTLIACERLGRKCRAVEISPAYVAVALERWATMTGQMPVLVN